MLSVKTKNSIVLMHFLMVTVYPNFNATDLQIASIILNHKKEVMTDVTEEV